MTKRVFLLSPFLAAGLLISFGCSARSHPSSIETRLANAAKDVMIPLEAEKATNPEPNTELVQAQGRQLFQAHCALCHSSDGHSHNPLGLAMYPPAMDLTSPHVQAWKDAELYWIIDNGIRLTGMPGWHNMLTSQEIWRITRYIHALPTMTPAKDKKLAALLAPPPPPVKPAATPAAKLAAQIAYGKRLLHQEDCLMCHTFDGQGGDVGPDLSNEAAHGHSAGWLIGHFKDPPKYSPGTVMPAFDNLTPAQLDALVALMQNARQAPKTYTKK